MSAGSASKRFRGLSEACRRLFRLLQNTGFGRVTFHVVDGQPDIGRPWRTQRMVKLNGGENGPRPEADSGDFELRKEHVALLEQMARLRDSARVTIEVKHGLPFTIEIQQEYQAA